MIKFRQAGYCNLKLILLYLVVYGHWIEPGIDTSEMMYMQYWCIYLIHMPLFSFLSGLFLRNQDDCARQIKRLLTVYLILQLAISVFSGGTVSILVPFWHLWYLLSYCSWAGIGWLWFRFGNRNKSVFCIRGKLFILLISVLIGALAGYIPWVNRTFSGSRTLAFFPFFWLGLICNQDVLWQKYRRLGMMALAVAAVVACRWQSQIPATFLYHAQPYGSMENGFWMRLLCYFLSGLLGFFLLTVIPDRRMPCTRAGADTMPAYLIHAPIVGMLRELNIHWALCALFSGMLLYIIYKILQWRSPLYSIRAKERRDRLWPGFRMFMNNTRNRYIDSFWL